MNSAVESYQKAKYYFLFLFVQAAGSQTTDSSQQSKDISDDEKISVEAIVVPPVADTVTSSELSSTGGETQSINSNNSLSTSRPFTYTPGASVSPESTISSADHAQFKVPHQASLDIS